MERSSLMVTCRCIAFSLGYDWRKLEDEVVIEISFHYLFSIELVVFNSIFRKILGHELSDFRHCDLVIKPEKFEWKFSFIDWPYPWGVEVEDSFWSIDGDLPVVFLLVRNTLGKATHHSEVIKLGPFRKISPVRVPSLNAKIKVESPGCGASI